VETFTNDSNEYRAESSYVGQAATTIYANEWRKETHFKSLRVSLIS